jgi:hypothetical protein
VHRNSILIYIQQDASLTLFILSGNCCTCFGWYHHPSSEAQTTVSTASVICHTVTAICRYRGRVGTGLSVLWVAYLYVFGVCICIHIYRIPDISLRVRTYEYVLDFVRCLVLSVRGLCTLPSPSQRAVESLMNRAGHRDLIYTF